MNSSGLEVEGGDLQFVRLAVSDSLVLFFTLYVDLWT